MMPVWESTGSLFSRGMGKDIKLEKSGVLSRSESYPFLTEGRVY